ncbi:nitroreductase family protein [Nocardioides sp. GY 10113]|uniref:nitroreductase family protein n=1 Tax=Nocardioides sp. GY 10113 TaxID=2569761 RepID=UPI0010A798EF|nr:nitroreductase family protein [Nocardioides sp. GY 10113]TIC83586.1 nitroreductase family protein [Nocardioides sp. GY 10113]
MEFAEVVRRRRMTRAYRPDPVDPGVLERALDRATRAPSAGFSQGWAFLVLDTPDAVAGFWRAQTDDALPGGTPDRWLRGMMSAPVVVVPCSRRDAYLERYAAADKRRAALVPPNADPAADPAFDADAAAGRWAMPYWHLDTAMAALLLQQSVVDDGLGCCFFGLVPQRVEAVKERLGLVGADAPHPIGAITIGHPADRAEGARGSAATRRRTPWQEVAHRGTWGAGWS